MRLRLAGVLALAVGVGTLVASDDEVVSRGARLYKTYCASCHGVDGKGDGPMADQLRYAPSDLTRAAKRARGKFPADEIYRNIDGRKPIKGHGGTEMPVWGDAFKSTKEGYDEAKVRERVTALVRYLESIQEK